jgi:hypothetical protein
VGRPSGSDGFQNADEKGSVAPPWLLLFLEFSGDYRYIALGAGCLANFSRAAPPQQRVHRVMSTPRDHHFIPAFLLRQWAGQHGKLIEYTIKHGKLIVQTCGTAFDRLRIRSLCFQ